MDDKSQSDLLKSIELYKFLLAKNSFNPDDTFILNFYLCYSYWKIAGLTEDTEQKKTFRNEAVNYFDICDKSVFFIKHKEFNELKKFIEIYKNKDLYGGNEL